MSRFGARPRGIAPLGSVPKPDALVVFDGRVMVLLGRTMSGAWKLLPIAAFGTTGARATVVTTNVEPGPAHAAGLPVGRPPRERRGVWTRH